MLSKQPNSSSWRACISLKQMIFKQPNCSLHAPWSSFLTEYRLSITCRPLRLSEVNSLKPRQFALKAIALDDKSPEAWSNLASALAGMERQEEALQACDRTLDINPSYARVWPTKAMTLLKLKRYDEALLACDQALILDSSQDGVLYAKSLILKELQAARRGAKALSEVARPEVCRIARIHCGAARDPKSGCPHHKPRIRTIDGSLRSFEHLHVYCSNFPGQLGGALSRRFSFHLLFPGVATKPISPNANPAAGFCDKQRCQWRASPFRG